MCKLCKPNDNIPWGWQFCKKRNGLGCTQCEKTFVDILMLNKHYKEAHTEGISQANFQEEKQTNKLPPTNASKSTALAAPNAPIDPPVSSPPLAASSVTAPLATCAHFSPLAHVSPLATCAPACPLVHSSPPDTKKPRLDISLDRDSPKPKCPGCDYSFFNLSRLEKHYKEVHLDSTQPSSMESCSICPDMRLVEINHENFINSFQSESRAI